MFGGDPFADPFNHMRRQMAEMDRMMSEPFGMMNHMNNMMNHMMGSVFGHQPMLGLDGHRPHQQQQHHRRPHPMDMDLFGGGGFGFGGNLMCVMDHAVNDPNSMVFSQSTMITMNPDGTQRVISNSTRKAGDVKETRHAVRDGEKEHVAVGHHIGDRTHVIEKKRDKDGRLRQEHRFVNMNEDEADEFNQEFKSRASRNLATMFGAPESHYHAIENGKRNHRSIGRSSNDHAQSGSSAPIITIPDDDSEEEEEASRPRPSRNSRARHDNPYLRNNLNSGPTIREISDEEAEAERSKRRKGMFGKFFGANDN